MLQCAYLVFNGTTIGGFFFYQHSLCVMYWGNTTQYVIWDGVKRSKSWYPTKVCLMTLKKFVQKLMFSKLLLRKIFCNFIFRHLCHSANPSQEHPSDSLLIFPLENYKKFHFRLFLLEIGFSAASLPFEHAYYTSHADSPPPMFKKLRILNSDLSSILV